MVQKRINIFISSIIKRGLVNKTVNTLLAVLIFFSACKQEKTEQPVSRIPSVFQWEYASPESQGMSSRKLDDMKNILAEKGTKKLLILRNDKIVYEWFAQGWEDSVRRHYTASLAKALVGGMSLLTAIDDGNITLHEAACYYIPEWKDDGLKSKITVLQLATHTSGIEDAETSEEEQDKMRVQGAHLHFDLPGWKGKFWRQDTDPFLEARDNAPVTFTPGQKYAYSNPGIAMLTYAVTSSLRKSPYRNIRTYLNERIFRPVGIDEKEYSIGYGKTFTAGNLRLVPSWGGGSFTARAVARIGLLMLHKGNWQGDQLIDTCHVERVTTYQETALPVSRPETGYESDLKTPDNPIPATTPGWYCNYDGKWNYVPRDAFAGAGAGNQHLMVIPSLNMVIVRMGDALYDEEQQEGFWLGAEKYLFNPVMDAIEESPYPESKFRIEFASEDSVIRLAKGCDNWPSTWADDDDLYAAYGDGYGFLPNTDIKLSLGLARVIGDPPSVEGVNLRSNTGERVGQGKYGEKASGMLMVDSVLYMLVRNAQNAVLMWSSDHGKTWEYSDWKFDVSFGCPNFINYGKNYDGAEDNYIYIYSHEEASAYKNSDHFVLARVRKERIRDWKEYEFFAGYTDKNKPLWSADIRKRQPVFTNPAKCYRSGMTYNEGLKKYLWCQTIQPSSRETDVRFTGGLGIFESDNPWGPWETLYYTREWDIGPGESSSIPTKWMSRDGKTGYLLFSGDDYFSLRKLTISRK
jgi:CubicO group peptidase (beta-lactamase class C family)